MAGLFFWHNKISYNPKVVDDTFAQLGYKQSKCLSIGKWNVLVFPKLNYDIQNWLEFSDGAICCIGTFAYKGNVYEQALPYLYNDLKNDIIDEVFFWGSFIILALINDTIIIVRDGAGLSRLYRLGDEFVFSTSFAGLVKCSKNSLNFSLMSSTELLTTGVLTGNQTLVKEIKRVSPSDNLKQINTIVTTSNEIPDPGNREEALNQQIEITKSYFNRVIGDWQNYMPNGLIDIGITGGMDSRLVAALSLNSSADIVFHTHWRKEGMNNNDFRCAFIFANETGRQLNFKKVLHPIEMSASEIEKNFHQTYCLSDSVIRPGCYWDEQYSTSWYRSELTEKPYLRLLGFGGEQYRNRERLPLKSGYNLQSWISWEMMYRFSGRYFTSESEAKIVESNIAKNLIPLFGKESNLNLYNFKKYVRLIQSPSYRSLQASMENRIGFCINPFLDICLSHPSQKAIPFLGKSLSFQLDMIKRVSPEIASIPNCYGFNFSKGEPLFFQAGAFAWQAIPQRIKYPLYAIYKKVNRTNYIPELAKKHKFIREILNNVLQLGLPINFKKHCLVRTRAKLLLNLGYFLKRSSEKIKL